MAFYDRNIKPPVLWSRWPAPNICHETFQAWGGVEEGYLLRGLRGCWALREDKTQGWDGQEVRFSFMTCQHSAQEAFKKKPAVLTTLHLSFSFLSPSLFSLFCRIFWGSRLQSGGEKNKLKSFLLEIRHKLKGFKQVFFLQTYCWQNCWVETNLFTKSLKATFLPLSRARRQDRLCFTTLLTYIRVQQLFSLSRLQTGFGSGHRLDTLMKLWQYGNTLFIIIITAFILNILKIH